MLPTELINAMTVVRFARYAYRDRTEFSSENAHRGTTGMADVGRQAAPGVLRLVAAGGPGAFDGEIRFHSRLTVLADARPGLADWVVSLLGVHAPADTLLEIDNAPARTYDLPRALRALPPVEPLRVDMIRALAAGHDMRRTGARERTTSQIAEELSRWEKVLGEAKVRLVRAHDVAPRVDPTDLAEASRLRNEWRYSVHVDAWENRRRSRREATNRRNRFDEFLEHFGATSYEDLSMVGTGFGDTRYDVAIREAATVVSMAEQRCHKLRMELDTARRNEALTDEQRKALERAELPKVDLDALDPEKVDRLVGRALAEFDDTAYVRPLVVDGLLELLSPAARRRSYDRLLSHARRRQIVLITGSDEVARWAANGATDEVGLRLHFASLTARD
jgi:hypothetical protein